MFSHAIDAASSLLFTTLRVLGSVIDGPHSAVLISGKGIGGFDSDDDNVGAETFTDQIPFGAPGIVWRPRIPSIEGNEEVGVESFGVRTADGPQPIAYRDLRWNRNYPNPGAGDKSFVGDAGGFLDFRDVSMDAKDFEQPDPENPIPPPKVINQATTWYIPYGRNEHGVPLNAAAIAFDPEQESLSVIHGDGYAITMDPTNGIVIRESATSFLQWKDGKLSIVADTICLQGNVSLGRDTQQGMAIPLVAGAGSQPTPSVYFSIV